MEVGAFSADRAGRLSSSQSYDMLICDAATGRCLEPFKARELFWSNAPSLVLTPDGKTIAVTSQGKFIQLIDFESGKTGRDLHD